ncbi:MAG: carboxymuconolactone decarboxylase family protein [Gammaproteobacteria bacterium]|nr:carboxymuconolactone decarboxylase family protein [Gammaproteobacteria bacterium]
MARIPLIEPEQASADVRAAYGEMESIGFPVLNVTKLFANNPKFLNGLTQMALALYQNPVLSPRYRELAYLRASQVNVCHY